MIQTKEQLLQCYGFKKDGKYKFVDNATAYEYMTTTTNNDYRNYKLNNQLYNNIEGNNDSYDKNIQIYVCQIAGGSNSAETCDGSAGKVWKLVDGTDITFLNAGSYQIKFVISDVAHDYMSVSNSEPKNSIEIILCYYVNPRVLLIRPLEKEKDYGSANTQIGYCVYATTNTNMFFTNIFKGDTYSLIADNYESALYGVVYCDDGSANHDDDTAAQTSPLNSILVNDGRAEGDKASFTGKLSRTYATGSNKYNMVLNSKNAYEDAGYYYITLGDLKIDDAHAQNYIVRLHPSYLSEFNPINPKLVNYYDDSMLTDNKYNYGVASNSVDGKNFGETVSNVRENLQYLDVFEYI